MLTHFSLCTGGGGIDMAAEMAGFVTVAQCEIDPYCNLVLESRWPGLPYWEDIRHVTARKFAKKTGIAPGELALLSAGIPCQPHSYAGARQGSDDERDLKDETIRCVREIRPRWVLVENVPGLLSSDDGRYFGDFLRELAGLGYDAGWASIRASDIGAKHIRKRVGIVAYARSRGSCRQDFREEQPGRAETERGSEAMADPAQKLCEWSRPTRGRRGGLANIGFVEHTERVGQARQSRRGPDAQPPHGYDGVMEHPDSQRGCGGENEREDAENARELPGGTEFGQGQLKSRLGGTPDGLADWLDSVGWIADKGEAKKGIAYPWEPPRVAVGVENRGKRVKMIGNGVVPQWAYLYTKVIADITSSSRSWATERTG